LSNLFYLLHIFFFNFLPYIIKGCF
jgi:hypothetical protein